jgi:molybdenum cofactor cytidylyltransferase
MSAYNNNEKPCSIIILAAGNSSRMKSPKFALPFDKKYTFLEKIIQEYDNFGCNKIIVVLNKEGKLLADTLNLKLKKTTIVVNNHPEWERFYSIKVGLESLTQSHPVFIHNVDNPFVNTTILGNLLQQDINAGFVVPTYKGRGGHPILISNKVCQAIVSEKENAIIFSEFLKDYNKKRVDVADEKILVNINSKDLYQKYFT